MAQMAYHRSTNGIMKCKVRPQQCHGTARNATATPGTSVLARPQPRATLLAGVLQPGEGCLRSRRGMPQPGQGCHSLGRGAQRPGMSVGAHLPSLLWLLCPGAAGAA